ncbi:hypothetical protein A0H81_08551 [Grifola frondosa]|uniref:Uncharacterized protein n=1 Tax=Grifola frondosa TaxID=5627 RepID=A0A1C7M4X5_GRIFR|nr:hypothetical protein A0H81_08551 [Grifola frondosa]
MRSKDLDLPLLLWALSWNVPALVTDLLAKYERTSLLVSAELPDILSKWYKPPCEHRRGIKTMGASKTITQFSLDCVQTVANREMCKVGQFMQRSPDELSEEELLAIKWDDLKQTVRAKAPTVWSLLRRCSWTVKQHKRNTMKDPDSVGIHNFAFVC